MKRTIATLLLVIGGTAVCQAAPLADATLLIQHEVTEVGADGITRQMKFQERFIRRGDQIWVERILPAGAHDEHDHAKGGQGHKHLDLAAAARWIVLGPDKRPVVRLVNRHDKVIINVPEAEYGNIGYDGNWENALHLLAPAQLQNMKETGRPADHLRVYESGGNARRLKVTWDTRLELPRRVESVTTSGLGQKRMVASDQPAPAALPWATLQDYRQKEYSDYLD